MTAPVRPFSAIIKPIGGRCNLACTYCYYSAKPELLYPGVGNVLMSAEVLERFTEQYLRLMPVQCDFNWHGGEPLLAGLDFFRHAVSLQKNTRGIVRNTIQTNGVLLDERWCEFFVENDFLVGISIDGPKKLHDSYRCNSSGNGYFDRVVDGLKLLQKYKVQFNAIASMHKANASFPREIYDFFRELDVRHVQFIPIMELAADGRPAYFSCPPQQYGNFMLEILQLSQPYPSGGISIGFIDDLIHTIIYGNSAGCSHRQSCASSPVLEWNGDFYACDHYVTQRWLLGSVMNTPLVDLMNSARMRDFAALKTDLPERCRVCRFLRFCNGSCPKYRIAGNRNESYFCESYRTFFASAVPILTEMLRGADPGARPTQGQSSDSSSPGRNDPCPCGSGKKFKRCCGL